MQGVRLGLGTSVGVRLGLGTSVRGQVRVRDKCEGSG